MPGAGTSKKPVSSEVIDLTDEASVTSRYSELSVSDKPGTSGHGVIKPATASNVFSAPDSSETSTNSLTKGKQPRKRATNATVSVVPVKKPKPAAAPKPKPPPKAKPVYPPKPVPHRESWDPASVRASALPDSRALKRVKHDIVTFKKDPPEGIFVHPLEEDQSVVHAVVVGPPDTPYDGGFFHFLVRFTNEYPMNPPKVKLLTTDGGRVRFNPNLYSSGKVCLSILGTWDGPSWTPCNSLLSVLLSIQSLMNENLYANEPGYERVQPKSKDVVAYNQAVLYSTLRVAVIANVEDPGSDMPQEMRDKIREMFPAYYQRYVKSCKKLEPLQGRRLCEGVHFEVNHNTSEKFEVKNLRKKLEGLLAQLAGREK